MESEPVTFDIEKDQRVQDLRQAIDSTVFQLRTASFTLVAVAVYLFVAGLGTSDLDLLLGRIEKLPVVDLDVSLLWFYVLAPPILIVVHATVLNLCRSVAHRLRDLQDELNSRSITDPDREFVLGLLYPYPLVERLTQPPERTVIRLLLNSSIYLFAVIMPIMALMWLGLRFLAYQDVWISAWQSICVLLDLAIVWSLWSRVLWKKDPGRREARPPPKQEEKSKIQRLLTDWLFVDALITTVTAALAVAPVCIGALWGFENLPWGTGTLEVQSHREAGGESAEASLRPATMTKDELNSRLTALQHVEGHRSEDFVSVIETGYSRIGAGFQKRSLRGAKLNMALVGADLSQADLTSADLTGADLRNAILRGAILDKAKLDYAHLEGADLTRTSVRGADLPYAQLQGAILYGADFTGADLTGAHLQLARLNKRGASDSTPAQSPFPVFRKRESSDSARARSPLPVFRGAILKGAQMQGMPLEENSRSGIDFTGADLRGAQLHGVDLRLFELDGGDLTGYVALPGDDESYHDYVCGKSLVLADCASQLPRDTPPPNFAQLSYDAARVVTQETLAAIGEKLRILADSQICRLRSSNRCGMTVTVGTTGEIESMTNAKAQSSSEAAADVVTQLKRLSESTEWCRVDPSERALSMRAFVHRIYEYECKYQSDQRASAYRANLEAGMQQVFEACGVKPVEDFSDNWCSGDVPKEIPIAR